MLDFDLASCNFLGRLGDENDNPIANTGLWGLAFGNGGSAGNPNTLYFAAGINDEASDLFGSISALTAVAEPSLSRCSCWAA